MPSVCWAWVLGWGSPPFWDFVPKAVGHSHLLKDVAPETIDGPICSRASVHSVSADQGARRRAGTSVPVSYSDDVDPMIAETRVAGADGVRCIVDGGHPDMDRDLEALKRIAAGSGVHIVASGGFYMQRNYPAEIATKTADQIADDLVRDAKAQRLGAFGEIGQQGGVLTDDERKVFTAVGKAQKRSGLPVFMHNAYSGVPVATPDPDGCRSKQLDVPEAAGADVEHLAIGHVCCLDDPKAEIAQQLAKRGAFVGFDRVRHQRHHPRREVRGHDPRSSRPATPTTCCCRRISPTGAG